ncbi:MAG: tryptophan--tRNA ligase [Candidatus Kerfeldbacteria bacterium]|nr:tryptophan--tRNA ligase [Candidatus Kerfeldbacteria bacterium]
MFPREKIIFSGVQPTGELHLGNYLGALKNWSALQEHNRCFFCVVDYHAITIPYQAKVMSKRVLEAALDLLAVGLDPEKCVIFVQSQVPEHTELSWILSTLTPLGELERMTQYKDKASEHRQNINAGLLTYPVLMAADILLYQTDLVPVGEDQTQHVELTRILARKFNNTFGEYFKEPKVYEATVARVMSLLEPNKKMSKSLGPNHCLSLNDPPEVIRRKIAKAVTDEGGPNGERVSGGRNLLNLFKVLSEDKPLKKELEEQYQAGELKYAEFKPLLADTIIKVLEPIQARRAELATKPQELQKILLDGRDKARLIAQKTLRDVKERIGLA